jgi:hypothetical protein
VEYAEAQLDRAINDHRQHSREADDRNLNAERQHCWDQCHQWWNGKQHLRNRIRSLPTITTTQSSFSDLLRVFSGEEAPPASRYCEFLGGAFFSRTPPQLEMEKALRPTVFYRWQKELFENGAAAFQSQERPHRQVEAKQKRSFREESLHLGTRAAMDQVL